MLRKMRAATAPLALIEVVFVVPHERDGKPHKVLFNGTEDEGELLLDLLTEQKTPEEKE